MNDSIGKIAGKTSTSGFKFVASAEVKKWDYIKAVHPEVGDVLAQVIEVERQDSTTSADCVIIGYRAERGFLRQPRTPLDPGADVYIAEDSLIEKSLGLIKGGLYIGLLEGKPSIKSYIDPEKLLTKHLAIIAKSGAGKSYAAAVLLEELMDKGFPIIIIDPHGEYSSIKFENKHAEDAKYFQLYGIQAKGYKEHVKEFALNVQVNPDAAQLKLPIPNSAFELVESVPFKLSNAQKGLLYSAINELKDTSAKFDFEDIVSYVNLTETNAKWGLISAIESLQKTELFTLDSTPIEELLKPGQLTIINLKGASPELQEIAVSSLAIKLFEQRKLGNIPPFFLVIEEAHIFCPERGFGEARSSKIIRALASEGRKFGLGLCVVSQRPARIDKNVLSQCTSQIVFQVTNPNDLKAISLSFEGVRGETENEIRALPIGKALVIGAADYPTFVDIRVRRSSHGGRAEKIVFEIEDDDLSQAVEQSTEQMSYAFKPRILKKDLMLLEEKEIKEAKLVLSPVLCINGLSNKKNIYLVFDLVESRLLHVGEKLSGIKIPIHLTRLSPMQKKVLGAAAISGRSTVAELMLKTGLNFGESNGVVDSLIKSGFLRASGKEVELPDNMKAFLDLSKLNFLEKADYMDLPGQKLGIKISQNEILDFLKELGIEITNQRQGWLPYWQVTFADGTNKTADALTWSLVL